MNLEWLEIWLTAVEENGAPPIRTIVLDPGLLAELVDGIELVAEDLSSQARQRMFIGSHDIELIPDAMMAPGQVAAYPPVPEWFLRCHQHEDCREHPELGRACFRQRVQRRVIDKLPITIDQIA